MIPDKIALLMEETGCDRGEAELALEMCGYVVEEAVKAIPKLHKSVVVFKGKMLETEQNRFGLLLVALNAKSRAVLRCRVVLSFNPAVCAVSLDKDWFEFEKYLFGCRLWEGSLPNESLELEVAVANHLRSGAASGQFDAQPAGAEAVQADLAELLKRLLLSRSLELKLKKDILDMGQFQSLRPAAAAARPARERPAVVRGPWLDELLILKVSLEEDPAGMPAAELRAGDLVSACIADDRDIARYLAKFLGGHSENGSAPILAQVEAIEAAPAVGAAPPQSLLVRVRFSAGACGDAEVPAVQRLRVMRTAPDIPEKSPWWQRFFGGNKAGPA
jgi:hypothetical protein